MIQSRNTTSINQQTESDRFQTITAVAATEGGLRGGAPPEKNRIINMVFNLLP